MLHLRVISPADLTEQVLAELEAECGATHIAVQRGTVIRPEGDVIEATLAREATNAVLTALHKLGVEHRGGVTLESLDTVLSDAADRAEEAAPGDPDDAVIWDELIARTGEESRLNGTFIAFLSLALLIAAVGVTTNSPVTVVGAMVVGPEFGPLAALAVALVRRRWDLARRSLLALLVGFPVAMGITLLGAVAAEATGLITTSSLNNLSQVDFVFQVRPFSLIVALLAGAAGMLSMTSAKSAALVGVFISVTTVPAAGFAVVAATLGRWRIAAESTGQLLINLAGITIAAVVVLTLRRRSWSRSDTGRALPEN
ncbi:MAG: DUF389 domain-containing protein [Actinomycetota bacterium]|nr:DUF389 domain-containing protein [Actinomycetota bacterium]